jgi:hypothetical protein
MTPKEKASNLVDKFMDIATPTKEEYGKQCALIAIDELKYFHDTLFFVTKGSLLDQYLDKVKIEIEKL